MAAKNHSKEEEKAWEEYLASIEAKPGKKPGKGVPLSERIKALLRRIGIGKAGEKAAEDLEKQVAISAEEGRKIAEEAALEKPEAAGPEVTPGKELGIEKYFAKVDLERKKAAEKEKPAAAEKGKPALPGLPGAKPEAPEEKRKGKEEKKAAEKKETGEEKGKESLEKKPSFLSWRRPEKPAAEEKGKGTEAGKGKLAEKGGPAETEKALAGGPEKKKGLFSLPKKVSFLPKAGKPEKKGKKPPGKKKMAEKPEKKKPEPKELKPAAAEMKPARAEKFVEFLAERPSLAKKPISEIKKLPQEEIKKELKLARIESKARGWYGDSLRHKKAAFSGWRIRKKVSLHKLKKKEKKGKLTSREEKQKRELLTEDRELLTRIKELESKIKTLKKISEEKKKESKILEKKVKAVGITVPKAASPIDKGRAAFRKKDEMRDLVEAMRGVADEIASAATRQAMAGYTWKDNLTIDEQMSTQQNMIKNLEIAYYKRKIDFDQFREKMFEYQAKLAEMKIQKKVAAERMERMPPEAREQMVKQGGPVLPGTGVITEKTARALEKIAEHPSKEAGLEEKTAEAIKKLVEKEVKREAETKEERAFAEKTASALQKIAEKLNMMPGGGTGQAPPAGGEQGAGEAAGKGQPAGWRAPARGAQPAFREEAAGGPGKAGAGFPEAVQAPQRPKPKWMPRPAAAEEEPEEEFEERPAKRIKGRKPQRRHAVRYVEEGEEEAEEPRERIVERIREKIRFREPEKAVVSSSVDQAIKQKAAVSGMSREQIDRIEEKLGELLEKYHIPDNALAAHIQSLDSDRLVQDFQKLIHLIETKKESAASELIRPAPGFDIKTGVIARKREMIVGKEKEIRKARIETSFDRLLNLVQMKGIINISEAAGQLGLDKKEVQECAEVLERSRLIQLSYPPIGPVKLIYPGYLEWKRKEKKKQAEGKKKK